MRLNIRPLTSARQYGHTTNRKQALHTLSSITHIDIFSRAQYTGRDHKTVNSVLHIGATVSKTIIKVFVERIFNHASGFEQKFAPLEAARSVSVHATFWFA